MKSNYYYCAFLRVTVVLLLFSFSRTSFAQEIPFQTMELIGSAALGWDEGIEVDSIYIDSNEVVYEFYDIVLTEGEFKFRTDTSWSFNWGGTAFPEGDLVFDGSNIPIAIANADTFNIFLTFDAYDGTAYSYQLVSLSDGSSSEVDTTAIGGVSALEYNALVDIYHSLNGDNWTNNTNWLSDEDVSTWFGVTVVNGHVTHFNVGWNNASGVIPSSISDLSYVTYLGFYINDISGMEDLIRPMPNVKELYINANNLTSLPSNLDLMDSLDILAIQNNLLDNSSLEVLKKLKSLTYLDTENSNYDSLWKHNKFDHLGLLELKNELVGLETFTYANQDFSYCCGETMEIGDSTMLSVPYFEDDRFSSYQWFMDGDSIIGANDLYLTINSAGYVGAEFHLEVVDDSLPSLILPSTRITHLGSSIRLEIVDAPVDSIEITLEDIFIHYAYEMDGPFMKERLDYDTLNDVFYKETYQYGGPQYYYYSLKGDDRFREIDSVGNYFLREIDQVVLEGPDTVGIVIEDWDQLPKIPNLCDSAEYVMLGDTITSDSAPNWYYYVAEEDQNLMFVSSVDMMMVNVFNMDCNALDTLSSGMFLNLYEGDSVLIQWSHAEGEDIPFDWYLKKSEFYIVNQLSDWNEEYAVSMEEIGPLEYEGYVLSNKNNSSFIARDGYSIYRIDNDTDGSGILRIYYDFYNDSVSYELHEEVIFAPEMVYSTDTMKMDNSMWYADEEITMEFNLAGTFFENQNYDDAYIYFWLLDSIGNQIDSDIVNGPWAETLEKNKLTHLQDSLYAFTFNPASFLDVDPELIDEFGFQFLIKTKDGALKTIDSTYPLRSTPSYKMAHQVNLSINMNLAYEYGLFDPLTDTLVIESNLYDDVDFIGLTDDNDDLIYEVTVDSVENPSLIFKAVILGEEDIIEYQGFPEREYMFDSAYVQDVAIWFNDEDANYPASTFTINMDREALIGDFDMENDDVHLILYHLDSGEHPMKVYPTMNVEDSYIYTATSHHFDMGDTVYYRFVYDSEIDDTTSIQTEEMDLEMYVVMDSGNVVERRFNNESLHEVTFNVNMSLAIEKGILDPNVDTVDIAGTFNGWGEDSITILEDEDGDGIYSVTLAIVEDTVELKTRINMTWDYGLHELDGYPNRMYQLYDEESTIDFWYDEENGDYPTTYFAVNMMGVPSYEDFTPENSFVQLELFDSDSSMVPFKTYEMYRSDSTSSYYTVASNRLDLEDTYYHQFSYGYMEDSVYMKYYEEDLYMYVADSMENEVMRNFNNEILQEVTINVNMSLAIELGIFDPSEDSLDIAGTFNNWGEVPVFLMDEDEDGIYSTILYDLGDSVELKTRINQSWEYGEHEMYDLPNREYELPLGVSTIDFWYDNEYGYNPETFFAVNMEGEEHFGNFDPEESTVELEIFASDSSMTPFKTYIMAKEDSSLIYTASSYMIEIGGQYHHQFTYTALEDSVFVTYMETEKSSHMVDSLENIIERNFDNRSYQEVSININMNTAMNRDIFDPMTDTVDIAGNFNGWGETPTLLMDEDEDGIYSITLFNIGDTLEFKTRINQSWGKYNHELNGDPNRFYELSETNTEINVWYDDVESDYPVTTFAVNLERELYLGLVDTDSSQVLLNIYEGLEIVKSYQQFVTADSQSIFYFPTYLLNEGGMYDFNFSYMSSDDSLYTDENIFRTYTVKSDDSTLVYAFNDKPLANTVINMNMTLAIEQGIFDPAVDSIDIAGNFNAWGEDGIEYLTDEDGDGIYSTVLHEMDAIEFKARINQSWEHGEHELAHNDNRLFVIRNDQEVINLWYDNEVGDHPSTTIAIDMNRELQMGRFTDDMLYIDVYKNDSTLMKRYLATSSDSNSLYTITSHLKDDGERLMYQAVFYENVAVDTMNLVTEDEISVFTVGSDTRYVERWFNNEALVTTITLMVDMSAKVAQGAFQPESDYVDVAGSFNDWNNDSGEFRLSATGDHVYQITFNVEEVQDYSFKFRINGSWNDLEHEFPGNGELNRMISPVAGVDNSYMYYFNNEQVDFPEVLLKVNMEQQVALGKFDPTVEGAEVRIKFFEGGGFSSYPLILNDDGLYGLPFNKFATGETYSYKFMYQYPNGDEWTIFEESIDRTFEVGEGQQTTSEWYNNEVPDEKILAVWSVNMQQVINSGQFDINSDVLTMKGSFDNWTEVVTLSPISNGGNVYTTSISLPEGRVYYKLFINDVEEIFVGQVESDNRFFDLTADNSAINVVYQFEETTTVTEEKVTATETEEGTVEVVIDVAEVVEALGEDITFTVMLADGSPLPDWIIFDPETMTFTIDPSKIPAGERVTASVEDLDIIILANNTQGESMAIEVNLPVDEYISNITSLEDILTQGVRLYPTLIDQTLNITLDKQLIDGVSYQVIDIQGRPILSGVENDNFKLNFEGIQSGMYMIRLQNGQQSSTFKVIKQ